MEYDSVKELIGNKKKAIPRGTFNALSSVSLVGNDSQL
jgi:hypothetical protein